jgi:hypothetical protein
MIIKKGWKTLREGWMETRFFIEKDLLADAL